jgi:ATP-dependent RNA helicase RhlE
VLIFTRTKHGANRLIKQLQQDGIRAAAIHGNKSQSARTQALADFKGFKVQALVATEVASRGLDIKELPYVVNYELPNVPEDYVHRIGRTGRAGSTGIALSLVAQDETGLLKDIERLLGRQIPRQTLPSFAPAPPDPVAMSAPASQSNRTRSHRTDRPQRHSRGARPERVGGAGTAGGSSAAAPRSAPFRQGTARSGGSYSAAGSSGNQGRRNNQRGMAKR